MGIVIDSSVLIAWERDQLDLQAKIASYAEEDFAISAVTASELLHGVHRATTPAHRSRREAFVEGLYPVSLFSLLIWSHLVFMLGCRRISQQREPP
jgi:predicted nucleic acid-binding protein